MRVVRITSIALVIAIAAAACQEQGLLTAPGASPLMAKGGGGGSRIGSATLAGGFSTFSAQSVEIVSDGARKLELHADQTVFQSSVDLSNTIAAGIGGCTTEPAGVSDERKAQLLARMADALQNRYFNAAVDRQGMGAPSATHSVAHTWTEADGVLLSLRIGPATELLPGNFATATEVARDVFVYTGGAARIIDRTGSVKNHVYMACPNRDTVTVTLTR